MLNLSVVIPSYNRPDSLPLCLKALAGQTLNPSRFEVIVVNDGSRYSPLFVTDMKKVLKNQRCLWINESHCGPASARNLGIKKAKGEIILFLGDDIIASPNLLKIHCQKQNRKNNLAVLGHISWHPSLKTTPFREWLYLSGLQNDYNHLCGNQLISFRHFYTGNLSIRKNFLLKHGLFDEDFNEELRYFEDTELGYRLVKQGLRIRFCRNAEAWHLHDYSLQSYLAGRINAARAGRLFYRKHPELKDKIFPTRLPAKEILRLKFWQALYPLGRLINSKKILFNNYQRLVNEALIKYFFLNQRQAPKQRQRRIKI